MNIHIMICALTLAHTAWISYTSLWILHLSDIFDFPDVITAASDEDISNLEDILKL